MLATTIWALLVAQSLAKDLVPHGHQQILNENADNSGRLAYFDTKRVPNPHYKINFIYEQRKTNEITEIERIEEEIGKYLHHQNPSTPTTTTEAQQNIEVVNEKETKETANHRTPESAIHELVKHHLKHEDKQIEDEIRKYMMQHHHPTTTKSTLEAEQNIEVLNEKETKETTNHRPPESAIRELVKHHLKHEDKQIEDEMRKYMQHHHPTTTKSTTEAEQNIEVVNQKDVKETTNHRSSESPIIEQEKHHHKHEEKQIREIEQIEDEIRKYMQHHHPTTTKSTSKAQQNIEVVNQKDIKETTTHRPSESTIIEQEKHHRKHEEKEVTEIEHIEEEIVKYIHFYHPSTMTTTTEAQYDIEVLNKKDFKDSTNANTSETSNTEPEKHEEKEAISTLPPMPLPPKLREPFNGFHPHFPLSERRPVPHRHPNHRIHIARTTSEAPVKEEARIELSPSVTQSNDITTNNVGGSQLDRQDLSDHKSKPFPHGHPYNRLHTSHATSKTPVEEETQTELSPPATQSDEMREITNYNAAISQLDRQDLHAFKPKPFPYRHPNDRLHTSHAASKAPVEEETQTELSPPVTQSDGMREITNYDAARSQLDRQELRAFKPKPFPHGHPNNRLYISHAALEAPVEEETQTELSSPVTQSDAMRETYRHPNHRLHISRTTSEAPVEVEAQPDQFPSVKQLHEMGVAPNKDVAESHLNPTDSLLDEPKPIPHRHPVWLHTSRKTSAAPIEEEEQTDSFPSVTLSAEETTYEDAGSHIDRSNSPFHEPKATFQRHPSLRLHISEASVEEEVRTVTSPPVKDSDEMKEINYISAESYLDRPDSPSHQPRLIPHGYSDHQVHFSRITSEEASVEEETGTMLSPPVTQPDEMENIYLDQDGAESPEHRDFLTFKPRPISHGHLDHRLHVSRTTSESPVEVKARTNNASTDKRIHLSQTLDKPSFRHKDRHSFANIRPRLNDRHGSIGLAPRPVYRGSYKFSWDDIYDMHSSTAPKVSQLKENPTPPPVPTLSPWYDGYGK